MEPTQSRRSFLATTMKAGAAIAVTAGAAGGVTLAASSTSTTSPNQPTGADAPSGHRWTEYYVDNFSSFDTKTWYRYHSTYGDALHTVDYLRPQNVRTQNGALQIITQREKYRGRDFTSGFISTTRRGEIASPAPASDRVFPRAGFYEFKGKVHHGQGIHHGCWLRHRDGAGTAEVDVMETFHDQEPGKTRQTLHLDGQTNTYMTKHYIESPYAVPQWHTWGVAIIPSGLIDVEFRFYTDGKQTGSYVAKHPDFWLKHPDRNLWDLAINTHTGGVWVGDPDDPTGWSRYNGGFCLADGHKAPSSTRNSCKRPGQRPARLPAVLQIDYVKVWRLDRVSLI